MQARNKKRKIFTQKNKKNIAVIFSYKFISNIQELRMLLIQREEDTRVTDAWLAYSNLVFALKADPIREESLMTVENLIENILSSNSLDADSGESKLNHTECPYSKSRIERLFTQILVGISMAFAGFKAGAVIGAAAGGGILSVPSIIVGGSVGAVVGGMIGTLAASKAHTFFRPKQAKEAIIYNKLASINKELKNRPKIPHRQ